MTHYRLVEDHLSAVSNLTSLILDLITEAVGYCGQFISFPSLPFLPLGSPSRLPLSLPLFPLTLPTPVLFSTFLSSFSFDSSCLKFSR